MCDDAISFFTYNTSPDKMTDQSQIPAATVEDFGNKDAMEDGSVTKSENSPIAPIARADPPLKTLIIVFHLITITSSPQKYRLTFLDLDSNYTTAEVRWKEIDVGKIDEEDDEELRRVAVILEAAQASDAEEKLRLQMQKLQLYNALALCGVSKGRISSSIDILKKWVYNLQRCTKMMTSSVQGRRGVQRMEEWRNRERVTIPPFF